MAKPIYTHPELAAHLRNLFARGTPYGWGGLQHHMEKAVEKTIDEMFENKEVIFKNNLIQLPPRGAKRSFNTKEDKEYWKFVDRTAKEVEKWPDWMKGLAPKIKPANPKKPKRHEGG